MRSEEFYKAMNLRPEIVPWVGFQRGITLRRRAALVAVRSTKSSGRRERPASTFVRRFQVRTRRRSMSLPVVARAREVIAGLKMKNGKLRSGGMRTVGRTHCRGSSARMTERRTAWVRAMCLTGRSRRLPEGVWLGCIPVWVGYVQKSVGGWWCVTDDRRQVSEEKRPRRS